MPTTTHDTRTHEQSTPVAPSALQDHKVSCKDVHELPLLYGVVKECNTCLLSAGDPKP